MTGDELVEGAVTRGILGKLEAAGKLGIVCSACIRPNPILATDDIARLRIRARIGLASGHRTDIQLLSVVVHATLTKLRCRVRWEHLGDGFLADLPLKELATTPACILRRT